MKRNIITLFALLFSLFTYAESMHNVRMTVTPLKDNTTGQIVYDSCYYYYNAKNQVIWEQQSSIRYVYTYNAAGQRVRRDGYSWVEAYKKYVGIGYKEYEYNTDGTLKEDRTYKEVYNQPGVYDCKKIVYTKYDGDVAIEYSQYNNDVLWYNYQVTLTKNAKGQITKKVTKQQDPDTTLKRWVNYLTETYTYQTNGDIKTYTNTPDGKDASEATYYYADFDANYVPQSLTASCTDGVVTLKWDAVSGASQYLVTYDQFHVVVDGNSLQTVVPVGERTFVVQPIIDGAERNASTPVTINVTDATMLPITDLKAGAPYSTMEKPDEGDDREFYNIPLTWTIPEGHSDIKDIIVYYDSKVYGKGVATRVQNPAATNYILRVAPFEMAEWDSNGTPFKGINTPVYVAVEYFTGLSDKSNVVYVNPFDAITTAIKSTTVEAQPSSAASYNVAGQTVSTDYKGIVIKNGKKTIKK